MSKKVRSIFSLAVAFCMIFSLAAVNVSAASVARNAIITLSDETAEAGDTIIVNVNLSNTENVLTIGYRLSFDPNVFSIDTDTNEDYETPNCIDADFLDYYYSLTAGRRVGATLAFGANPEEGTISVGGTRTSGVSAANNINDKLIGGFVLTVKSDAILGDTTITLIDASTSDAGESFGAPMIFTPVTFTVAGGAVNEDQDAPTGLVGVAPTVAGNDGKITGTSTLMEYKLSTDPTYTACAGAEITGLAAGTYNVRYAAKEGFNAGADATVTVPAYVPPANQDQDAPTGLVGVAPTVAGNDGKITGTSTLMEYKLSTDPTYTACAGAEITGLAAGTYNVRYAAKEGFNAGADATVTVPAYVAPTTYTLSKGTATNGTLVFDPANGIVEAGQSVEVIATPDPGYEFVAFTGASTSTTSPETIIMDGNKTIGATFQLISTVEPTMILGSQVAYRGTTITVPVSVKNVPTGIAGINFSVGYEPSAFEYLNITLNNSLLQENGIDTATGAVAVAAILQDGVNLEDDAIIANISFAVKADAELGDEFLTFYNVFYGGLSVTNFVGGKITISVATDPNLPAALAAVQAYKEAPLTSIALVEVAEGLEQDALDAIDELDPDLSESQIISLTAEVELHAGIVAAARARFEAEAEAVALVVAYETGDLNTLENVAIAEGKRAAAVTAVGLLTSSDVDFVAALNTRISDRDTEIAEAREALEKANALNDVNAGTFVIADLISLGVNNTQVDKLNQYKVAVIAAKAFNGTILAEGDLQDIITAANGVDLDTDLGYVRGEFANKVLALDAACAKDHLMSRRVKGSMTVADFVKEAIRADMDKNGVIDAGDITDILVMSANQNLVQD